MTITYMLQCLAGLMAGGCIGLGFGVLQDAAREKYRRLQQNAALKSEWTVVGGAGQRIAFLLIALALIQIFLPALASGSVKWWVTGGAVAGYAASLYPHLRRVLASRK